MAYGLSAYGPKKDERTTHEKWCDEMVKRANNQRVRSVKAPVKSGLRRNNYSNSDLKKLLLGLTF